jgi:hypothetical protein
MRLGERKRGVIGRGKSIWRERETGRQRWIHRSGLFATVMGKIHDNGVLVLG